MRLLATALAPATRLGKADFVIHPVNRPAPSPVLKHQREASAGRVHLEDGPRTDVDAVGGILAADGRESGHREPDLAPRDLTRSAVKPIGSDSNINGLHADDGHRGGSSSLWLAVVRSGTERMNGRSISTMILGERTFYVKQTGRSFDYVAIVIPACDSCMAQAKRIRAKP